MKIMMFFLPLGLSNKIIQSHLINFDFYFELIKHVLFMVGFFFVSEIFLWQLVFFYGCLICECSSSDSKRANTTKCGICWSTPRMIVGWWTLQNVVIARTHCAHERTDIKVLFALQLGIYLDRLIPTPRANKISSLSLPPKCSKFYWLYHVMANATIL